MIAIISYNAGNTASVAHAVRRLGYDPVITDDLQTIAEADKVILPGVGAAGQAMAYLETKGLAALIPVLKQPVLGVCLGLQLMCMSTAEDNTKGLGIFPAAVQKFPPHDRVPHTGWNNLSAMKGSLFQGVAIQADLYFVHSYYAAPCNATTALCDYILPFSAALQQDNFFATQFHPEKSAEAGGRILQNFLNL